MQAVQTFAPEHLAQVKEHCKQKGNPFYYVK